MYDVQFDGHSGFETTSASPAGFGNAAAERGVRRPPAALQAGLLVNMLDEIDYGMMVLSADAQILHANQLARLELDGERFVRRRLGKLVSDCAHHGAKVEAALVNIRRGQRSLVTLSSSDGDISLSFVPLHPGGPAAAQTPDAPLALVIFGRRDACEALTLQQYARLHGLTGAEQALLPAVIRGLSVEAIAQQQCVSRSTVRTQLGSIREKTGAKSLRSLTARLITLPPIRPSLKQAHVH